MKLTRAFSLLLALIMALCVLAACNKAPDLSGPGDKAGEFSIPTEYSYSAEVDGVKISAKINVTFKENELSLVMHYEQSKGEFSQTETEKRSYLLDEFGNVVREVAYRTDGKIRYLEDYFYGAYGARTEYRSHGVNTAPEEYTAYTAEGDTLTYTTYNRWGSGSTGKYTYTYDEQGRLLSETTNYGSTTLYEYDDKGNLTKTTNTYGDEEPNVEEIKNAYSGSNLKSITRTEIDDEGVEHEIVISVGSYKSFKMTKGQYVCIMLMTMSNDPDMFRGEDAGSGEIRYADGTVYKKTEQNGNTTKETFYLPEGKLDYICETVYENGKLRSKTITGADGEVSLSLNFDANGDPIEPSYDY